MDSPDMVVSFHLCWLRESILPQEFGQCHLSSTHQFNIVLPEAFFLSKQLSYVSPLSFCELLPHWVEWDSLLAAPHYYCDRRAQADIHPPTHPHAYTFPFTWRYTHKNWDATAEYSLQPSFYCSISLTVCPLYVSVPLILITHSNDWLVV